VPRESGQCGGEAEIKILVANLDNGATEDSVRVLFEPYGQVMYVGLVRHPDTGRPGGACLVDMSSEDEARRAIAALDGQVFVDKRIGVSVAPASAVLLTFGISPAPSDTGNDFGQPPALRAVQAMLENTESTIALSKSLAIRMGLMLAAGLAVCSLFLPGMPLADRLFPVGVIPIAITGLLFIWFFIAAVGPLAMKRQRSDIKRLVDDLTPRD